MTRFAIAILCFTGLAFQAKASALPYSAVALVYAGPGACTDGNCARNAADVAIRAGLLVRFVLPGQITSQTFENAVVWIQPGGDSIAATQALSNYEKSLIREFVYKGGGYLGFCAGAYLAAREIDTGIYGLGLLSGEVDDYTPGNRAAFIPETLWNFQLRDVYFEDGPFFNLGNSRRDHPIAFYPNGKIAAMKTSFGHGHVAVSGPHPEAPPSWRRFYNLEDADGLDYDLAHDLLNWAIRSHQPMKFPDYSSEHFNGGSSI